MFRVETPAEPGSGTVRDLSPAWADGIARADRALAAGRVVAAVGEPGSGRATLLAQAQRQVRPATASCPRVPRRRTTSRLGWVCGPPSSESRTPPSLSATSTTSLWVAERLRDLVIRARAESPSVPLPTIPKLALPFSVTAEQFEDIPAPLASLVETIVQIPPLRERADDVMPLARHAARRARGRDVDFTAAERVLRDHAWPGNVEQLQRR